MNRVNAKVALVTGGAAGLGEAMAKMLAREGAKVAITDLNDQGGERVAASIHRSGGEAFFRHHDVTDERAWQDAIAATLERFGRLDVLVNNAGVGWGGGPEEQTLERWRALMSINLDGVFLGTKHAIAAMKKNKPSGGWSRATCARKATCRSAARRSMRCTRSATSASPTTSPTAPSTWPPTNPSSSPAPSW